MHSTMCRTGQQKLSAAFWCQQYCLVGSAGKQRQRKPHREVKKNHYINSWVTLSQAGALLQKQQTKTSTIVALPGPFPPFPATISWMLLLLSQSRPLSTALALPQRGVVLLHITHFISPVKHFCISFPLFCGLVITDWPNCFPVVN